MRKWTTTTIGGQPGDIGSVTLSQVLQVRECRLNPAECLALLGQTGNALQDVLLSLNGRRQRLRRASSIATSTSASSRNRDVRMATVHPQRVLCTTTGRVVLSMTPPVNESSSILDEYSHPEICKKSSAELTEGDLETIGLYSLAQTISKCLSGDGDEEVVRRILVTMKSGSVSLLALLQTVSQEWTKLVGASPISRYVAQLCRRTQGWNSGSNLRPSVPVLGEAAKPRQEEEEAEVEFSRMDSNSSNSSSVTSSPQLSNKPLWCQFIKTFFLSQVGGRNKLERLPQNSLIFVSKVKVELRAYSPMLG